MHWQESKVSANNNIGGGKMKQYNEEELQFMDLLESGKLEEDICSIMDITPVIYEILYNRLYCTKNGKLTV
jgi:hypothetical protein